MNTINYFRNKIVLLRENRNKFLDILKYILLSFTIATIFDRLILNGIRIVLQNVQKHVSVLDLQYGTSWQNSPLFRYFIKVENFSLPRIYFFACIIFMGLLLYYLGVERAYKNRYFLAILLLILLVCGKFTGSSLGFYDGMLLDNTDDYVESTLLGNPQGLRGDEWATEKPYYFAQSESGFEYYNPNLMLGGCDMVISAFAPVKNILILARPDLIGFLFLPKDYAFSFYWNLRIILLFMASLEFGVLLTQKKKMGVVWALLVTFATPVQWWLSQALMIILWSGEYFVVFFSKIIRNDSVKSKVVYSILSAWMGGIYILSMYPATQVPMGYIFAGIIVYIICVNWKLKPFSRINLSQYFIILFLIAILCLYFYKMSGEALLTMLNTYYPGKSRAWVSLEWDYELLKFINPIMWIKYNDLVNNCESSQFYSFAPFVIFGVISKKKKIKDKGILIYILLLVSGLLWMMSYLPHNEILSKVTLLSFSYPVRIMYAVGFGFMLSLLLFVSDNRFEEKIQDHQIGQFCFCVSIVMIVLAYNSNYLSNYFGSGYLGKIVLLLLIGGYVLMGGMLLSPRKKNLFIILLCVISIESTVFVNPVTYGTDSMFEKKTMKEIKRLNCEEEGRWMVSGHTTISNLVTAQGVARVSGTYYYPDTEMMNIIDPEGEYEGLWNQFAHIDMRLTCGRNYVTNFDKEQGIELSGVDRIVYVNLETAHQLGIKYVFTKYAVPREYVEANEIRKVYENTVDNWSIYKIELDEE